MPQPFRQDLNFVRGDDYSILLTMTTNGVNGISVSGWSSLKAFVRHRADDSKLAAFALTITDTANGIIRFSLTSGQTQTLPQACVWDFERVASGALQTVLAGFVTITPDVSYGT